MAVTLADLRARARERADMVSSHYVENTALDVFIDRGYAKLWERLITLYEDIFANKFTINLVNGTDTYSMALASPQVHKVRGLDLLIGGAVDNFIALRKYEWTSRQRYANMTLLGLWRSVGIKRYRYNYRNGSIVFAPIPNASDTVTVHYIPVRYAFRTVAAVETVIEKLVQDGDHLHPEIKPGWEEYIALYAAWRMLSKEQNPEAQVVAAEAAAELGDIEATARDRDAEEPPTMSQSSRLTPEDDW